jgi:hypothetical protein
LSLDLTLPFPVIFLLLQIQINLLCVFVVTAEFTQLKTTISYASVPKVFPRLDSDFLHTICRMEEWTWIARRFVVGGCGIVDAMVVVVVPEAE